MKRLFLFLLKKYTKNEKDRLVVFNVLHEQVVNEYHEQTVPGQIYAAHVEFLMSSKPIVKYIDDIEYLDMIKVGLDNSFDQAVDIIKIEY